MSAVLSKTLKDKDMDRIFAEVPCTEDLGLSKPGQLRLFHLLLRDGKFYHEDLEKWLYRNLSRYVFSRAIQTMRENGAADEKGMGNELGEMMIYAFLEGKLSDPKLMSRVELSTDISQYKSVCESIPNPEVYLKLVTEAQRGEENAIFSTFAPITQFKFLISQETKSIRIFNDHTQDTIFVCKYGNATISVVDFMNIMTAFDQKKPLGERKRDIAYFSGKNGAIDAARAFAEGKDDIEDDDLKQLANDIRDQVHGDYYLTKLIRKGIAYNIGYLPASIRQKIEKLFKDGKITAMFCTSTIIEEVNLPADNLFITNYRSGIPQMTSVEFRNLIGRVGRIKFNLYRNVFFINDGNQVTE